MDCHEPHPAPNEKTQPIQWTERPTGALVAVNSLWPYTTSVKQTIENYGNLNKFFVKKNEYVHWIWALKTINASLVLKG